MKVFIYLNSPAATNASNCANSSGVRASKAARLIPSAAAAVARAADGVTTDTVVDIGVVEEGVVFVNAAAVDVGTGVDVTPANACRTPRRLPKILRRISSKIIPGFASAMT